MVTCVVGRQAQGMNSFLQEWVVFAPPPLYTTPPPPPPPPQAVPHLSLDATRAWFLGPALVAFGAR